MEEKAVLFRQRQPSDENIEPQGEVLSLSADASGSSMDSTEIQAYYDHIAQKFKDML
jgi:hypothetical protein